MSSITMFGFFGLAAGCRVSSQKPGASTKSYHCFYTTALQCTSGVALPAELRVYSPFNDTVLEDNTVAFVVAKVHFPKNESVLLEVSHVIPLPGDPSSDDYDNNLPNCPYPFIIGIGSVPSRYETLSDGVSKAFNVVSSEFIRDSLRTSMVRLRWFSSESTLS
ncbi:hypothetical protein PAXINDRAFT_14959 [Paxillus involutus ATCC 200175]|uniref:Uncharacterized protein n=1 Tax=Paxillus involutus ATCC 200175 TaxID=664439 RepID=A0A0C9TX45_PAXIN|nr:hypothetical protein PAXINDRAFT_14959 [Paxillus involutus ATCC 200175]